MPLLVALFFIFIFSSKVGASGCQAEPRLCDLDKYIENQYPEAHNSSLNLTIDSYLDLKPSVLREIRGNYTITGYNASHKPFSSAGFKFAIPISLDLENILSGGQKAFLFGRDKLAYRLLRYTKPKTLTLTSAIDKLTRLSPYNDKYNCFLQKNFSIRKTNPPNAQQQCNITLMDIFIALGGTTKNYRNATLEIKEINDSTCLYYHKEKRCFNREFFLPYKQAVLLLNKTDSYTSKDQSHLIVIPTR